MIRLFDFLFSFLGLISLSPFLIVIWIIGYIKNGLPIFKQQRLGCNEKIFLLIKFRTMKIDTKSAATHLVDKSTITPFGKFLRRTKIDEIPQLFNVLMGDMSLVGPRPCLQNQRILIKERKKRGVFRVKPGITGLGQISGIDMKTPSLLAKIDSQMVENMNLYYYFFYIFKTLFLVLSKRQ